MRCPSHGQWMHAALVFQNVRGKAAVLAPTARDEHIEAAIVTPVLIAKGDQFAFTRRPVDLRILELHISAGRTDPLHVENEPGALVRDNAPAADCDLRRGAVL